MIEGKVKYEGGGDVYIAAYIDGIQSNTFPDKKSHNFDHAECNNNAIIKFDRDTWKASVTEITEPKTKCNIYFLTRTNEYTHEMMFREAKTDTTNLAYDGTVEDSNLRYIGADPNNYVTFNGEEWRIIGTFKDIDDGTGRTEWRTKIIRTASLGNKAWDAGNVNEWSTSPLKDELNGSYLNGLSIDAQDMIGNTNWATGKAVYNLTAANYYNKERSGATWTGKIALMHVSDYGYAVGGDSRSLCLYNNSMLKWDSYSECTGNDWLFNGASQWTLTADYQGDFNVFKVFSSGVVSDGNARQMEGVRSTLYLSSNVMISGGSGTSTDPYTLTL